MLPRAQRLRDGREIGTVSRQGLRARSGDLGVAVRLAALPRPAGFDDSIDLSPGSDVQPAPMDSRAAVVVGKRSGDAVARNRQRRRLQHALAAVLPTLPPGTDVVVRGGPGLTALPWPALCRDLESATRRALARSPR